MQTSILLLSFLTPVIVLYMVWPSRWNAIAHIQLAFSIVAYVVPIAIVRVQSEFDEELIADFSQVLMVGSASYFVGAILAGIAVRPKVGRIFSGLAATQSRELDLQVENRISRTLGIGILLMMISFIVMGYVPMFADDPLAAKFFRGEYKSSYDRISVVYRMSWTILRVLIGPAFALAMVRVHEMRWKVIVALAASMLLFTLSRTSLAQGVLIALVVYLIWKRHSIFAVFVTTLFYVGGALYYRLLAYFGFSSGLRESEGILEELASTVPDVVDNLEFWARWNAAGGPTTGGKTILGGLVPGNYAWNPSVWSITLGSDAISISDVNSGGVRLGFAVWGMVNFGWPGVILISFLAGGASALIVARLARVIPSESFLRNVYIMTLGYLLVNSIFGTFYKISYLSIIELFVILWVLAPYYARSKSRRRATKNAKSS